MNGIAFEDDRQVVRCLVVKFRDKENPRAEIMLESVPTSDDEERSD